MTATPPTLDFALSDPETITDPYPQLHRVREEHPLFWHDGYAAHVVTRYDDITAVLKSSKWKVRPGSNFLERQRGANETVDQLMQGFYYFLDEPEHRRLRSIVSSTFTPRVVERFRPRIQEVLDELLEDSLEQRGEVEFMSEIAYPLTVRIVTEILGASNPEDQAFFLERSAALAGLLEWDAPLSRVAEGGDSMLAVSERFVDILENRMDEPAHDLVSSLITAQAEGRASDSFEIIFMCVLLLTVGYETTMNHLGNGVHSLLAHPDEYARIRTDPAILGTGVDELLRHQAPVQVTARLATEDIDVAGRTIREGEMVVVMLAGANRDPQVFPDPDRLDLGRRNAGRHLTFASGQHFCLGAALAKAESEIAFRTLAERYPGLTLAQPPQWRQTAILRSLDRLDLTLEH
jgi:pimeloyl-[acyl-carrier protein] synthase